MLDMTVFNLINTMLISAGIGVCGLCFLQITASIHLKKEVRRYFQIFFLMIASYISCHLVRELLNGSAGDGISTALYMLTLTEMIFAGLTTHMISILVLVGAKTGEKQKKYGIFFHILIAVHIVLLSAGSFFKLFFYFDENNCYHRAPFYLFTNICPVIMLIADMILLVLYRKNFDRRVKIAFWNYMIAPLIAIAIQSVFYDIQFIIFAAVVAAVYMFAVIVRKQFEQYQKQQTEKSRIETELTMASSIQADMLPNIYPAFPERTEFDIYATMNPAKEVGGDFYDFFLIDDDHLCMIMADVSGKGVPAALFMMASKIIFANNAMVGKSPAQILTDANGAICQNNREEMFVTVWLGILELSTGKLTAANAGHEYPALKKPNGLFELVKDKHGFVIGGMPGLKYTEYEIMLEPGSKLFLYTDGVPEATDSENNLFGTDRMLSALNNDCNASVKQILNNVRGAVDGFVKEAEQFDDLTMLCLEYTGE